MNGADELGVGIPGEPRVGHPVVVWYQLQAERLERELGTLTAEIVEARDAIDAVKALLFEVVVLPKLGN